jgi:hypothetical protein
MVRGLVLLATITLLTAGCAAGSNAGSPDENPGETRPAATNGESTGPGETAGETDGGATAKTTQSGEVELEQLSSGAMGPKERQVLVASSARNLSASAGLNIPDVGEGTYVALAWGEKPTGGYTVSFVSAEVEGSRVTVGVRLNPPPEDAMVSQALTYPYAAAVLPGVDPGEKEFVFVTQSGREIGWPIRSV